VVKDQLCEWFQSTGGRRQLLRLQLRTVLLVQHYDHPSSAKVRAESIFTRISSQDLLGKVRFPRQGSSVKGSHMPYHPKYPSPPVSINFTNFGNNSLNSNLTRSKTGLTHTPIEITDIGRNYRFIGTENDKPTDRFYYSHIQIFEKNHKKLGKIL
jgi:hypothetical protein